MDVGVEFDRPASWIRLFGYRIGVRLNVISVGMEPLLEYKDLHIKTRALRGSTITSSLKGIPNIRSLSAQR